MYVETKQLNITKKINLNQIAYNLIKEHRDIIAIYLICVSFSPCNWDSPGSDKLVFYGTICN